MRLLSVLTVVVAGLVLCGMVVDSYAAKVPIHDIGIPIYFGDPDWVEHAKPRSGGATALSGEDICDSAAGCSLSLWIKIFNRLEVGILRFEPCFGWRWDRTRREDPIEGRNFQGNVEQRVR